jgi:TniQ protein
MRRIHISDPAWQTTFPFLVEPRENEWLTGLLLRCDEVNRWGSGTTLTHILRMNEKTAKNNLTLIVPSGLRLDDLAQALAIPLHAIVATTYQAELARVYDVRSPSPLLLNTSFSFHLCPVCVEEKRMLFRSLALQHLTYCPQHQIALVDTCQCGASLRPFSWQALPFTCYQCGLSWAKLPRREAVPERLELEQKLLSYYDFFFAKGTPELLASTLRLIYDSVVEKGEIRVPLRDEEVQFPSDRSTPQRTSSLGYVVHALLQLDLSPRDILIYAGPLPWRSVRWATFQCPEPSCPYVKMIRDRIQELDDPGKVNEWLLACSTFA